jgi:hypothetical protein
MPSPTYHDEQRNLAAKWMESSNILVVVRCRPMSESEKRAKEEDVVKVIDGKQMIIHDPGHTAVNDMRKARVRDRHFAFDHAFGQATPSDKVYNSTTRFLVDGVVAGFNATVFAYGATGSGKTYTMLGAPQSPGLMVLTLRDLYKEIDLAQAASAAAANAYDTVVSLPSKKKGSIAVRRIEYKVSLSYVEVYNENIRDLLSESGNSLEFLDLREDPVRGNCVAGVSEHSVSNTNDIMSLLSAGNRRRTQEPTAANKESSRSHAVLQINVSQHQVKSRVEIDDPFTGFRNGKNNKVKYEGVRKSMGLDRGGGLNAVTGGVIKVGKFSLIDLAGSERAANTHNRGLRLLEGANINRSLLALGNCITALVQGKGSFVPYRDSKLTRLLKDSLGGNCRTVMISCISPAAASFEETCNTLKYANRAKNIRTNITETVMNKVDVRTHAAEYENLISGLRNEVATLKHKLATTGGMMNTTLAATLGGGGLLGFAGRVGVVSPAVVAIPRVSLQKENVDSRNQNLPLSSMALLSSPALKKTGMRSISPIQSPSRGGGGGEDGDLFQLNVPPSSPGGFQASEFERRSPKVILGLNNEFSIPEGYILINLAEAATAAEKLRVLREELVSNFQERMQIQRSLIELHAQTVHNDAEIGKRQVAIARYEQSLRDLEANYLGSTLPFSPSSKAQIVTQSAASAARNEIQELQSSSLANAKVKNHLISRLKECTDRSEAIRLQLDSQCNTDERRELLALEYRVCLLELDKIELEQSSLLRIHEAEAQNVEICKLKLALKARDRLLRVQSDLIKKHGLNVVDLAKDHGGVLFGPAAGLTAVDAVLSSYRTYEETDDEEDVGSKDIEDNIRELVDKRSDLIKNIKMVNESRGGEGDGKWSEDVNDVVEGDEIEKDKYSPQLKPNLESNRVHGDVSFVESTAEWMGSHFTAQSQHSFTESPTKGSSIQQQPRSPVNPPPAPLNTAVNQSTRNQIDSKNHYIASVNQSLANEQHSSSISSPPKAASWLERAVQLVRGVKSQMQTSRQQDEKQIDKGGNRISLVPVASKNTEEEFQGPLRPVRLQSLGRINSSEQMSVGQHDSTDSLPDPIMPLRNPIDRKAVCRDGLAKKTALSAVGMKSDTNIGGGASHFSNNDVGLPRRRMYAPNTEHVHHASGDEMNWQQDNNASSSSYLPISTTEISAALVLSEAKSASAEASATASVAALQRRELLVKRTSNERLIPLQREQAKNEEESKYDNFDVHNQRHDNSASNQEEEEEENESGLSYSPYVEQVKLIQPVQQQPRNDQNQNVTSKPLSTLPSSRQSLSNGIMQSEERLLAPAAKKGPVWLKAIPPHRPPISNALKMARAADVREKKEALERAASFDAAPSQATSLNHAIAAYSASSTPSRKAHILASGAQRQTSAPRAIRDPDERALHRLVD